MIKLIKYSLALFIKMKNEIDRQKMILDGLKPGMVLDLGSQDMPGNRKESLHGFLIRNWKGKVIGIDYQKGEHVDIVTDLDKKFPFKDNYAENIVAGELIEHLLNPHEFLKECYRVIKPGGRLILTTPNATGLQIITGKESPYHYFVLSKKNLNLLAAKSGFKKIDIKYLHVFFKRNLLFRGLGFLAPKLRPVLFAVMEKENEN